MFDCTRSRITCLLAIGSTLSPRAWGGPCVGGGWGWIEDPAGSIHVGVTGDDTAGDGSEAAPFASVGRALEAARARPPGSRRIALWGGDFPTSVELGAEDDGLSLAGCGPGQTTLAGGGGRNVVDFAANAAFSLSGATLADAEIPLHIRGNAVVDLLAVEVRDARSVGVLVEGFGTLVDARRTWVHDVNGDGQCGVGVLVRDGVLSTTQGTVSDVRTTGILVDGGELYLDRNQIFDVSPSDDGSLGRGIHLQYGAGALLDSTIGDIHDAGIFLLDPRGIVMVRDIVIDHPGAGFIPWDPFGQGTGDGIVVRGDLDRRARVGVRGNTVSDAARTGILFQDVRAGLAENACSNDGVHPELAAQGRTDLVGPQAPDVVDLDASPIPLYDLPLVCRP